MPLTTYLSPHQELAYSVVTDDTELNDLLQELRRDSGENWLIGVGTAWKKPTLKNILLGQKPASFRIYTLYADLHGEYQMINLVPSDHGSFSYPGCFTRDQVANYIIGYLAGMPSKMDTSRISNM